MMVGKDSLALYGFFSDGEDAAVGRGNDMMHLFFSRLTEDFLRRTYGAVNDLGIGTKFVEENGKRNVNGESPAVDFAS